MTHRLVAPGLPYRKRGRDENVWSRLAKENLPLNTGEFCVVTEKMDGTAVHFDYELNAEGVWMNRGVFSHGGHALLITAGHEVVHTGGPEYQGCKEFATLAVKEMNDVHLKWLKDGEFERVNESHRHVRIYVEFLHPKAGELMRKGRKKMAEIYSKAALNKFYAFEVWCGLTEDGFPERVYRRPDIPTGVDVLMSGAFTEALLTDIVNWLRANYTNKEGVVLYFVEADVGIKIRTGLTETYRLNDGYEASTPVHDRIYKSFLDMSAKTGSPLNNKPKSKVIDIASKTKQKHNWATVMHASASADIQELRNKAREEIAKAVGSENWTNEKVKKAMNDAFKDDGNDEFLFGTVDSPDVQL